MKIRMRAHSYYSRLGLCFLTFCVVFITIATVRFPKDAFDSAMTGLQLWWNVVFPALLPFFILSEILMGLGAVHFIGVILEPLMRPLFNVPGAGAFAMSMGLASGYPMDAVITARFRQNRLCTAIEAERLLSFTNTADPLFMFGAVAVGMFGRPDLGAIIALAHYISSVLVGLIFRFHGRSQPNSTENISTDLSTIPLRAFRAMVKARHDDGRSISQLLGDSVKNSMNTILLIGGFIILFSVFLRVISVTGLTTFLTTLFTAILKLIGFSTSLAPALVSGLFELDLGAMAASQADAPLIEKVAVTGAIIAWSGLCVHGQVASIVIESGIRMRPYMVGRLLHAILAAFITMGLMNLKQIASDFSTIPVFQKVSVYQSTFSFSSRIEQIGIHFLLFFSVLLSTSLAFYLVRQVWQKLNR
ncbi:sporulation integral membrane protein YlbJ [Anaerosporomusa subterranea]|jgi:sporulation integral membrane protein YlbJ|uniref:Sporulation integral membrane protein YlbJ n=1 Tax=Anaerosporomusa subterranea TaxID=1794912 RepID=A0A154BTP6_ANASB|nr:sporulation integral membrane protein YlbJ [Anaerosporomusa subterranea]KYZ77346.1 sporulation integral membrane protein YlbJ [Anaerosporomusa subterranea]MDF2501360.1 sporulation integral rane protein YlbJ [Anaerosporomusa subterranea]